LVNLAAVKKQDIKNIEKEKILEENK